MSTRALGLALAAVALGSVTIVATRDPLVFLAWLALSAAPLGAWLGGARLGGARLSAERLSAERLSAERLSAERLSAERLGDSAGEHTGAFAVPLWPWAAMVPGAWMIVFAALATERSFASPHWAAAGWSGLFLAGFGLGRCAPRASRATAALLAAAALVLAAAPAGLGLVAGAFTPASTARLLDLSPVTQLVELAGVDWMRHPALYEPARTLDIGPELRGPFRGALAGPLWLLVGCALAGSGAWLRSRPLRDARRA